MPEHIPYLRVFISSPGDVSDERKIALDVIKRLPNRPSLRDRVAFRIIAWDEVGADTPMRATLTPQEAINQGLPMPSQCDIVLVLFWSRMGTPFIHTDGIEYMSGAHWELLDALNSTNTETIIYRCTEKKLFETSDMKGQDQYRKVQDFFASELFYKDTRIVRGINMYASPDDFRQKFETHFEDVVVRLLRKLENAPTRSVDIASSSGVVTIEREPWPLGKSPFPGLRSFTETDADIFFGRGRETDVLLRRIAAERFLAVVGASGSGKSSLVGAGLVPRLRANAISDDTTGSKDWFIVTLKPGKAPFEALAAALMDTLPTLVSSPRTYARELEEFTTDLREKPDRLVKTISYALKGEKSWTEVLIFIDQFEELFTLASADDTTRFVAMLMDASQSPKLRVIVTMRDDFFHRANAYQDLSDLLQSGSFPLTTPRRDALRQMIERPAERAGLDFEPGLVEQILDDTGDEPGGLALMAYLLDELYHHSKTRQKLPLSDYETLGKVSGAIGIRAEKVFAELAGDAQANLPRIFHQLLAINEDGLVIRRRVPRDQIADTKAADQLVSKLTTARLLVQSQSSVSLTLPIIEVAHEALFRSWTRLSDWVEETRNDLRLLSQVRAAAEEWGRSGRKPIFLWPKERLLLVSAMVSRLHPQLEAIEQEFITSEIVLSEELQNFKGLVLSILNHEFRTPLTYIVAYADMLNRDADELTHDELRIFLGGINTGADRLRRLIENFMTLVELESGEAAQTYRFRRSTIRDFKALIEKSIADRNEDNNRSRLDVRVENNILPITGDEQFIVIALSHLIDNALKFSDNETLVKISVYSENNIYTVISVADKGRGIPLQRVSR